MELVTNVHTIYMMIGPTECGKTTFAKEVLMPQLSGDASGAMQMNVQYLSSDSMRQEILGHDYDKYDQVMLEASAQAFNLLYTKLDMVTSFPVNAEFVILDTTGLAEDIRAKVREIAERNHYHVEVILFDYRKREDYYASERSKRLITNHMNRLKKDVLGSLAREGYANIHRVRSKDFYWLEQGAANPEYRVIVQNRGEYAATFLPNERNYTIVGDVHECIHDLQGLLRSCGYRIEDGRLSAMERVQDTDIILVGDWIDKGKATKATIDFLYDNREHFRFVLGNHENFVYKYLQGEVSGVDKELVDTYFDSIQVLMGDRELLDRFNHLVSLSQPFYQYRSPHAPSFYVTHAPCRNKYIGKLDGKAVRRQRNFRIDRDAPLEEQLRFIQEEAVSNQPYHIFGHVAAKTAFRIKNKIHVDTGSVHGNRLTAVIISYKPFFKSHPAKQAIIEEELPTLFEVQRKVSLQELNDEEVRRLHYCTRNQINFISGTMSPSDKDVDAHELESLKRGLDYFAEHQVEKVVLQPKYMGSRCNIYLYRDVEQCFAVSRNGYRVKQVDLTDVYEQLLHRFRTYMEENQIAMLLLDGELLPWRAMGEGLIERQFKPIAAALESELEFLQQQGFEAVWGKLVETYRSTEFEKDQYHMSKAVLSEKYGSPIYQSYKHVHYAIKTNVPLSEHEEAYETYQKQLGLYAEDGDLEYKPFGLLKVIYESGEERIPTENTSAIFSFLSDDEYVIVDLTQPDYVEQAERYFSKLTTEKHMEGVVMKPECTVNNAVPYMKVRNADYLSLVYGYDYQFPHKYYKLIKQKNVRQKLKTSLNEYRLGQRMLAVKLDEITPQHAEYKELVANLLFEVGREKELDPRL
ncbi:AAA domain-containing protein [Paenibacillus sp. cl6col]|uniref:AAA family ATPase n=1 Tax=Paenibacillus sp. cl6col TaxID=1761878 RepID=UPI00088C9321|nr:AAA family ATPase [Paenibacillus sp. cl6col]SDE50474.1 AAA domain-containing protein [Paenibacillus sp. cl6col]